MFYNLKFLHREYLGRARIVSRENWNSDRPDNYRRDGAAPARGRRERTNILHKFVQSGLQEQASHPPFPCSPTSVYHAHVFHVLMVFLRSVSISFAWLVGFLVSSGFFGVVL